MEPVVPLKSKLKSPALGRQADRWASVIAVASAILAIIGCLIFFAGFVANDSYFGAIVSAFTFTALLGSFAVIPPLIIARITQRAYKRGPRRKDGIWVFILAAPWTALSGLLLLHAPLPIWMSGLAFGASVLLTIWAIVTIVLER